MCAARMPGAELGSAIKKKEIGCREAAEAYLTAIAEKDGKIKSYITVLDEEGAAREVSCAADGENTEKVLRSADASITVDTEKGPVQLVRVGVDEDGKYVMMIVAQLSGL